MADALVCLFFIEWYPIASRWGGHNVGRVRPRTRQSFSHNAKMAGLKTNPPYLKNEDWIPAFAGMTEGSVNYKQIADSPPLQGLLKKS